MSLGSDNEEWSCLHKHLQRIPGSLMSPLVMLLHGHIWIGVGWSSHVVSTRRVAILSRHCTGSPTGHPQDMHQVCKALMLSGFTFRKRSRCGPSAMSAKAGWDQGVAANKGSGDSRDMTVFGQSSLAKD